PCSIERRFGVTWPRACPMKFAIRWLRSKLLRNCCPSASRTQTFGTNSIRSWSTRLIASTRLSPRLTTLRTRRSSCSSQLMSEHRFGRRWKSRDHAMGSTAGLNWKRRCRAICRAYWETKRRWPKRLLILSRTRLKPARIEQSPELPLPQNRFTKGGNKLRSLSQWAITAAVYRLETRKKSVWHVATRIVEVQALVS